MNNNNWKHEQITSISITLDRSINDKKIHKLKLDHALGRLNLPEETLIWLPENDLKKIEEKLDYKLFEETLKLKQIIVFVQNYLEETYQTKYLTDYDKTLLIYRLINMYIRLPWKYINVINNTFNIITPFPKHLSEPWNTWENREGLFEGRARLLTILLNNPEININASTIYGTSNNAWTGIVIDNKLYDCPTIIPGPFVNLQDYGYIINNPNKQIYPSIYEHSYLSEKDIKRIEKHIKKLKK